MDQRKASGLAGVCMLVALAASGAAPAPANDPTRSPSPATFEDIYGPSGATFQGALGFRVFEGNTSTGDAQTSFGASVDDMVVQWREYRLIEDATDCSTTGACATVATDSSIFFETNGSLGITVVDGSPYTQAAPVNDCNRDGDFGDAGIDDQDCNDNGTTDVVVRATSIAEPAGEIVVLDRVGATDAYRGTLAISSFVNVPGVLYFVDGGPNNAEITIRYDDSWDGSASGIPCRASAEPTDWGIVLAGVEIETTPGSISIPGYRISDGSGTGAPPLPAGQDGDGFPDTSETIDLFLTVRNQGPDALTNVVAQLATSDPRIDCILKPVALLGTVPAHSNATASAPFRFKVASTADRAGLVPAVACNAGSCSNGAGTCLVANDCKKQVSDLYAATFAVTVAADQIDGSSQPLSLSVDLDLNSSSPVKATTTFLDSFENGFTNFVLVSLDDNIGSNALSNGRRCQYNDPDFVNSNSYGDTECYLGFRSGSSSSNQNDWHIHDVTDPDNGRAFTGVRSLHYGIHTPGNAGLDTYGLSQMDTIRYKSTLNLAPRICRDDPSADKRACNVASDCVGFGGGPCVSASPELSFKQQISTTDSRSTSTPFGQAADRAVLHVQIFPTPLWQKISPYQNVYDVQGTDQFSNCIFDPIDDGNDEDSYFDPSDPDRRLGPSSTCYPEFAFSYLGATAGPFGATKIGRASDGPGLLGSLGVGTWVESKFDLTAFRGRPIRFRWLFTSIKVSDVPTLEALFMWNPNVGDDGWFVDDVRLTQTLAGAPTPTVSQDTVDNSSLPACGSACNSLAAVLTATPSSTPAPGSGIVLSTDGSLADRCVGGALLSEFWIDRDANGVLAEPADLLLRPFSVDPRFEDAPLQSTQYGARVRCSSAPAVCVDTEVALVTVGCPGTPGVYNAGAWWTNLRFSNKTTLTTPAAYQTFDAVRGDLGLLRSSGAFGGEICLAEDSVGSTLVDSATPPLGNGYYYLLRGADDACNENRSWRTFSVKENPTDPPRRDTQVTACSP